MGKSLVREGDWEREGFNAFSVMFTAAFGQMSLHVDAAWTLEWERESQVKRATEGEVEAG